MVDVFSSEEMEPKGPSLVTQGLILLLLTVIAAGVGFGGGQFLFKDTPSPGSEAAMDAPQTGHETASASHGAEKAGHGAKKGAQAAGDPPRRSCRAIRSTSSRS